MCGFKLLSSIEAPSDEQAETGAVGGPFAIA
jgi:hypothetical protein